MNKAVLICAACACAISPFAAGAASNDGGTVRLAGKGRLAIVDCQSGIDWNDMKPVLESFDRAFHVEVVRMQGEPFSVETSAAAVAKTKSNAALFVGSRADYPMSLAAPEQKWAFVNVAPLKIDGRNFVRRSQMLLMRGIYRALGSDTSSAAKSCLSPVHSPADLDEIADFDVAMDTYMAVCQSFEALGIVPVEYGTYQDACEMGIAAPPTNAAQRAIWEKVHQLPTEPIKIKPETKKVER